MNIVIFIEYVYISQALSSMISLKAELEKMCARFLPKKKLVCVVPEVTDVRRTCCNNIGKILPSCMAIG